MAISTRLLPLAAKSSYLHLSADNESCAFLERVVRRSSLQRTSSTRPGPKFTNSGARPISHESLCSRCAAIDFDRMIANIDERQGLGPAFQMGMISDIVKDSACSLCDLFSVLISRFANEVEGPGQRFYLVAFPTSALYGGTWCRTPPSSGVATTISFTIFEHSLLEDPSGLLQRPSFVRTIGCISPTVTQGSYSSFQARVLGANLDIDIVKSWLNYCNHHHLDTCASSSRLLKYSTRVIDCQTKEVVPLGDTCTYLALSYVWGESVEAPAVKKSDTNSGFPQTVEDAINITRELGYLYLWVDRFCIPPDDVLEQRQQISQMDQIYARAEATIIAAAGDDPHYGLPGVHERQRLPAKFATLNKQLYTVIPPDPAGEIISSRWNSRAWTYQEGVLSRRRIIFCEKQVYFECKAMHCYEGMQTPLHLLHSSLCPRFFEWNEPGLFPVNEHRHVLDQLFHHLSMYTVRQLSYPDDVLNGMLGIFGSFTEQAVAAKLNRSNRRVMQIAGIPIVPNDTLITYNPIDPPVYHLSREGQFITGLSWKLSKPVRRRAGFPSWSWAGWYGAVLPRNDYEGYIRNTHDLKLLFAVPVSPDSPVDLKTILNMLHKKELAPSCLPSIIVTGLTVVVSITYKQDYFDEDIEPKRLTAFVEADNTEGYIACDRFTLTYDDPRLATNVFHEECIGLILGMAQCTYFAGADKRTRVLDDSRFPLIIMVLWERNGRWERLGLIEHTVGVRTDANTRPAGSNYLGLRTERRRLQLG